MTHVLLQAAETGHHGKDLPFDPFFFGLIAFTIALSLLGLLWSFRSSLELDPVAHHHDDLDTGATDDHAGSHH